MSRFTLVHEINCNADGFWKLFFDKQLQEKLYVEHLGYTSYSVIEQNRTETQVTQKVVAQPAVTFPGLVAKLMGSDYRHTEEGSWDAATSVWRARQVPSSMADKIHQEYTLRLEPIGSDKVRRIIEFQHEARIFGVGGLMESSFETKAREESDRSALFLNQQRASSR